MDHTYWQRQAEKPLFPELEWNKPERRDQAGRLLIIGGYLHNLNAPAKAYEYVQKQAIGSVKVALPSKTKALLGKSLPAAIFLPSTSSGELAQDGLTELIEYADWADTLLIPGDLGRNSQTTLLLADLLTNTTHQAVVTRDAVDLLQNTPGLLIKHEKTTLVLSFAQLQKHMQNLKISTALTFDMDLTRLVAFLHDFTSEHPCAIITQHQDKFIVAVNGRISTTPTRHSQPDRESSIDMDPLVKPEDNSSIQQAWRTKAAAIAACYQTWNPEKTFEALTHSTFLITNPQ